MEYTISNRAKYFTYALMGIGLIALIVGFLTDHSDHHNRFWSNLLIDGLFFFGISAGALFFLAVQYAAQAGWGTLLKRVFEAVIGFLPYGSVVILLVLLAGSFHGHHIYHWMAEGIMDPAADNYDAIIAGKSFYLNQPFFWVRAILYIGTFLFFARYFRKRSLREDEEGGTSIHFGNFRMSALFIVLFGIFSSALAWDWIMSITTHWYSTLFGWYVFSGMWCSAIITIILVTLYLKNKGLLPQVNESHIHDLGKWMFALSFLWSYLWFFQFMLIWYGNKPEEATYFIERIQNYQGIFFTVFLINLVLPMLLLMSRDAKRNNKFLVTVGSIIFVTHWLDTFLLIMPGTVHEHWQIGFMEIGMFLGFLGAFIHVTLKTMSKAPVTPVKHPFLQESIDLHT